MKKYFGTGVVILLPLILTYWIVTFLLTLFTDPFLGIAESLLAFLGLKGTSVLFLSQEQVLGIVSKALVLLFLFLVIITIGAVGRYVVFRYLMRLGDSILHKIPVISSVYKTSQELISTILSTDAKAFKQVVLVPFPHAASYTVGLVTRDETIFNGRVSVFVPTTPNPTSGYLIMYEKEKLVPIQMSVEEALRFIVSCGVLYQPTQRSQLDIKEKTA